jgi:uncharacterized protein (TIGR03086 family)
MLLDGATYVRLDAIAVRASVDLVAQLAVADLDRPTPCAGWTLRDLLAHMTAQHYGFAAAAAGAGPESTGPEGAPDLAVWQPVALDANFAATYADAADRVLASFAAPGVLDRKVTLPEISPTIAFPAAQAVSFHFIDYVVHSWDVARSAGLPVTFAAEVLDAALDVAEQVPKGERRLLPGSAFAPVVDAPAGAPMLDRIVAVLGRRPDWQPSTVEGA